MNPGKLNHRIAIWHNAPMGGQNELGADEMAEQVHLLGEIRAPHRLTTKRQDGRYHVI